jgi:hypothetical protein
MGQNEYDTRPKAPPDVGQNTSKTLLLQLSVAPINKSIPFAPVNVSLEQAKGRAVVPFASNISFEKNITFFWDWVLLEVKRSQCNESIPVPGIVGLDLCEMYCRQDEFCVYFSYFDAGSDGSCQVSGQTCTLVPADANTYKNPSILFETPPVLIQSKAGTQSEGLIVLQPLPSSYGMFVMTVAAIDSRKQAAFLENRSAFESTLLGITIHPRNTPPAFRVSNLSFYGGPESFFVPSWMSNIEAGFGECACEQGVLCTYGPWPDVYPCQNLTFSLVEVTQVIPSGPNPAQIFASIAIDLTTGNLNFSLMPNVSGLFRLTVSLGDDGDQMLGGAEVGGENLTRKECFLAINIKPTYTSLGSLVIPETNISDVQQSFRYFSVAPPIVYDFDEFASTAAFQSDFRVLSFTCFNNSGKNGACSNIFKDMPSLDENGSVTFTLETESFGRAIFNVSTNLTVDLLSDFAYDTMLVTVANINRRPLCSFPEELSIMESVQPQIVYPFATNVSAGPPIESWQYVIFAVDIVESPIKYFTTSPTIDSKGSLHLQILKGVLGQTSISVTCFDSGGTEFGGIDSRGPFQVFQPP